MTLEKLPSDDLWKLLSVFDDLLAIEKGLAKVLGLFELQWSSITRRDVILELFERQAGL